METTRMNSNWKIRIAFHSDTSLFDGRIKLYSSIKPQTKVSSTNDNNFDNALKCYCCVALRRWENLKQEISCFKPRFDYIKIFML